MKFKKTYLAISALLAVSCFHSKQLQADNKPVEFDSKGFEIYEKDEQLLFRSGVIETGKEKKENGKYKYNQKLDEFGVAHYRIPHLTRNPDGKLVMTIVCRLNHEGDHGKSTAFFATSDDDGKSWEYIRHDTNWKKVKARPSGSFPLTSRTNEAQVVWYPKIGKYVAVYLDKGKIWTVTSKDLKNWDTPKETKFNAPSIQMCWASPASLHVEADGTLVFAITGSEKIDGKNQRFARIAWTTDLENLELSTSMPVKGNETAVVPLKHGKYFVTTRIAPKRQNMIYNRRTGAWSAPWAFPAKHTALCEVDVINDNGTLYLSTPTSSVAKNDRGRANGVIYKSTDRGKTWDKVTLVTNGFFAYSSLIKLGNGNLGLVSERGRVRGGKNPILSDIVYQEITLPGK